MKKQFSVLLAILLSLSVLMGFSHANETGQASDNTVNTQVDYSIDGLRELVDSFRASGDIKNKGIAQAIHSHINNFERDFQKGDLEKAQKRLDKIIDFVKQQQKTGNISEHAGERITAYASNLLKEEEAFDANRAFETIRALSVDIGPRAPGSDGEKQAAQYLKGQFEQLGYDVSIQEFGIRDTLKVQLTVDGKQFPLGTANGSAQTDEEGVTGILYDAGLGLPEDFSEDAAGKIALIQRGEITFNEKVQHAIDAGAIGAVIYDNTDSLSPLRPSLSISSSIPVVGLSKADGEALIAQMNEKDVEANLYVRTQTNQTSQNVIAVKKPENVENPDIVYITAHFDSVAFSPGANDDASGTSVVLEMARLLKDLPSDKEFRFIAFGAEEIGLVGSNYYVSQLSSEEIHRSIANFQFEMLAAKHEASSYMAINTVDGQPNAVWNHVNSVFDKLQLNKEELILFRRGSSDHVPFHNAGIMATCFNMGTANGGLEPEYHTPFDSIENISKERLQYAGDIIYHTIMEYLESFETENLDEAA